jgi:GT2 family glycosyltransferase
MSPRRAAMREMNRSACDASFVIVSWEAKRFLRECLVSLEAATRQIECEIIVVDNASTDGSWEMVRDEFQEVVLLRNESNVGFARANNLGIKASRGRYVCLVNSDVKVFPDSIEILVDFMEANPGVGLVAPKILNSDLTLQPSCRTFPSLRGSLYRALALDTLFPRSRHFAAHPMTWWNYDDVREVDVLSGCFWVVRRIALEQVGGLDTRFFMYGEDIDFCRRFHVANWKVVFNPQAKAIHYGGASSANAPAKFAVEKQRADLQYFLKHDGRLKTIAQAFLAVLNHCLRCLSHGLLWILFPGRRRTLSEKILKSAACASWLTRTLRGGNLAQR